LAARNSQSPAFSPLTTNSAERPSRNENPDVSEEIRALPPSRTVKRTLPSRGTSTR
jgi:hypothetical protein